MLLGGKRLVNGCLGAALLLIAPIAVAETLSLAWSAPPRTVDSRYATDADSQYLDNLINCSLMTFDADGQLIGDLASAWTWKDPKTLEVKLREAKFDNGAPVTAADVKATYDFFAREDLEQPSPRAVAFSKIERIATAGDDQLIFHLREPDVTFLGSLVIGIVPAARRAPTRIGRREKIARCGPFQLASFGLGALRLVRNPKYTLGAPSRVEEIEIKFVRDEQTRFAKLQKGELDLVQNMLNRDKVSQIDQYPELSLQRRPGLNAAYIGFNMRDEKIAKPGLRRAIARAIDREEIIKHVLRGFATPAVTMLPPDHPYFNDDLRDDDRYAHNLEAARAALDAAGFPAPKDGEPRLTLELKTSTNQTQVTVARALAGQLAAVGIKVDVRPLEWARFKADVEEGKVQMWTLAWRGFKDPDIYRYAFATESRPPNGGNRGWYHNPEVDKLLERARQATDDSVRREAYHTVQKMIYDDLPYVFLWHEEVFAVTRKNVRGFQVYADGRYSSLVNTSRKRGKS